MLFQFVANGIFSSSLIAILAIGFWFIYSSTNLFHIAHGAIYTASAYAFYFLYVIAGITIFISLPITLVFGSILGLGIYLIIYEPLENKNASQGVKFISSLAVYILIVNVIALIYGNEMKIISHKINNSFEYGVVFTKLQITQLIIFVIIFIASFFFVQKTKIGRTIRAIGNNPLLFKVIGLNDRFVKGIAFLIGSAIASVAAILTSLDVGIDPHIGMISFLNAIVAVIIGGIKRLEGVVLGAYLIGITQSLSVWLFPGKWAPAITFFILSIVLLYKSGGLFTIKGRVEEL